MGVWGGGKERGRTAPTQRNYCKGTRLTLEGRSMLARSLEISPRCMAISRSLASSCADKLSIWAWALHHQHGSRAPTHERGTWVLPGRGISGKWRAESEWTPATARTRVIACGLSWNPQHGRPLRKQQPEEGGEGARGTMLNHIWDENQAQARYTVHGHHVLVGGRPVLCPEMTPPDRPG